MSGALAKLMRLQPILQEFTHMKSKAHDLDIMSKILERLLICCASFRFIFFHYTTIWGINGQLCWFSAPSSKKKIFKADTVPDIFKYLISFNPDNNPKRQTLLHAFMLT